MQSRVQAVEGSVNFRDFGGYTTEDGTPVKAGLLYRCGTLAYLTDQGRQQLLDLGIELICDLRRPDEKTTEPTPFADHPQRLEIPIDPGSAVVMRQKISSMPKSSSC